MPDNPLEGKVALITGGAHRIGAAVARMLHAHGMKLVIHYHTSEKAAHALQEELHQNRPESVMLVRGDLTSGERQARNLVFETVESFDRLDVLVNNASRFYPTPVGETTESQWDDIVRHDGQVNLPHPDIRRYAFVLRPLADIAPDLRHPETGLTCARMWEQFGSGKQEIWKTDFDPRS